PARRRLRASGLPAAQRRRSAGRDAFVHGDQFRTAGVTRESLVADHHLLGLLGRNAASIAGLSETQAVRQLSVIPRVGHARSRRTSARAWQRSAWSVLAAAVAGAVLVLATWWFAAPAAVGAGAALMDAGRLAGLLAGYVALVQVLLRARLPVVE